MRVTVREFIEASERNGFPWAGPLKVTPTTSRYTVNTVLTCVVGQGMLNLKGMDYRWPLPNQTDHNLPVYEAFGKVMVYNDKEATSYEDAVRFMKEKLAPFLDEVIEI